MADQNKSDLVVGVDFGGTKILAGVFNRRMNCLGTAKISTKALRGSDAVVERIARCVQDAVDEADLDFAPVHGVGVGAPGAVDSKTGTVILSPNLDWHDVALKKELERHLHVPVFVENDGNAAMLGVHVVELKSKPKNVVGIFIGTVIGGGLILDGELHRGFSHTAGELGHIVLDVDGPKCRCGNKGCFEALASRMAIFQQIKTAVKSGQQTVLTEMLGEDLKNLRSGDLRKAIRQGDKLVDKVVEEAAEYIGLAVANLVNILNPEIVVLGGGVIEALADEMLGIITEVARDQVLAGTSKQVEIIASELGDQAGITGGAVLAWEQVR